MEKLITEFLDSKFQNDFTFKKIDSRHVQINYNESLIMWFNPRNNYIRIEWEIIDEIGSWFGVKDFNIIRKIIIKWLLNKYKCNTLNIFIDYVINNN